MNALERNVTRRANVERNFSVFSALPVPAPLLLLVRVSLSNNRQPHPIRRPVPTQSFGHGTNVKTERSLSVADRGSCNVWMDAVKRLNSQDTRQPMRRDASVQQQDAHMRAEHATNVRVVCGENTDRGTRGCLRATAAPQQSGNRAASKKSTERPPSSPVPGATDDTHHDALTRARKNAVVKQLH